MIIPIEPVKEGEDEKVAPGLSPPSLVEMELSITPRTISLGTKCANDHMVRCARLTVVPSS